MELLALTSGDSRASGLASFSRAVGDVLALGGHPHSSYSPGPHRGAGAGVETCR